MKTHFLRPTDHPNQAMRLDGRSTICGIAGHIDRPRWTYEYEGGPGEMIDIIGERRYDFTDRPDGVDCKRCLAAMKRLGSK